MDKINIIDILADQAHYLLPEQERIIKIGQNAIYVQADMYANGISMGSHATRDDVEPFHFVTMLEYAALTSRNYQDRKIQHIKHMREIFYISLAFAKQLVEMSQHIKPIMTHEQIDAQPPF